MTNSEGKIFQNAIAKLSNIPGNLWYVLTVLLPGVAVIGCVLLVTQGNVKDTVVYLRQFVQGPLARGILSLEPPQVYTRERLVNDRFRQANWLENQLDSTNEPETIKDIGRVLSTIRQQTGIDVTISTVEPPVQDPAKPNGEPKATPTATSSMIGSLGQRLVETDKLRNRLRTDLMDTLLDDGHDLEGNTLYRLNFDAVVMPIIGEPRYPGTAVYVIRARNPFGLLSDKACIDARDGEMTPPADQNAVTPSTNLESKCSAKLSVGFQDRKAYFKKLERKQAMDDVELLRDWQTEIQRFLTRVVEQRVQTFREDRRLNNPVDPKEDIALDWYLRLTLVESFLDAIILDPEIEALCRSEVIEPTKPRVYLQDGRIDSIAECQNWIAKTLGLKWRHGPDTRSPDFDFSNPIASRIEAAFRRGIRLADHINAIRDVVGQQAHGQNVTEQTDRQGSAGDLETADQALAKCERSNSLISVAHEGVSLITCGFKKHQHTGQGKPEPQQNNAAQLSYEDRELKKALVRMITVWQAMHEWGMRQPEKPQDPPVVSTETEAANLLLNALDKFRPYDPDDAFIEASRPQLFEEAKNSLRLTTGMEYCFDAFQSTGEGKYQFYRCAMIHASAGRTANNLIAKFILARLKNELPIYDWKNHLSLGNFVDISLAGCGTTGCQIQVKQHKDVSINEFVAGQKRDTSKQDSDFLRKLNEFSGVLSPLNLVQELAVVGSDKDLNLVQAGRMTRYGHLIKVVLNDEGVEFARELAKSKKQGMSDTAFQTEEDGLDGAAGKQNDIDRCLNIAKEFSMVITARTEAYFACRLRQWVNAKRSDLTVYGVSPRAGSGDDLVGSIEEFSQHLAADASAANRGSARLATTRNLHRAQIKANPSVIGFGVPPGMQDHAETPHGFIDEATFGWAIRPERMSGEDGYLASRHRLSAVISVPSWWKRIEFEVEACWVMPGQFRTREQQKSDNHPVSRTWYEELCSNGVSETVAFSRTFEIQVPRRVAEITDRFNFDFIKAPYFYRDFIQNALRGDAVSLEAGRPGKIVLHGERLWRGTFVSVNHQPANRIIVLPDMKGVVASFDCVRPPDGAQHVQRFNAFSPPERGKAIAESLLVWTSQGSTRPLPVQIYPFTQRAPDERPCWMD
ncbi:MAG: hypothetical protein AB8B62_14085 [Roseobacter sp.]